MSDRLSLLLRATALAATLALAACGQPGGGEAELANLDNQIVGNDADPALTSALADQILVDPALANQSNRNAVRPPETPVQAQYPVGQDGARTRTAQAGGTRTATRATAPAATPVRQASVTRTAQGAGGTGCGGTAPFDYNKGWANRMSAAFAAYPGGTINQAAGTNKGDCRVRVVTFTTGDAPQRVLGWYSDTAGRAGYSAEHQRRGADHVLGGTNDRDGGAFYLIVTPLRNGGSDVALIANNGR